MRGSTKKKGTKPTKREKQRNKKKSSRAQQQKKDVERAKPPKLDEKPTAEIRRQKCQQIEEPRRPYPRTTRRRTWRKDPRAL
jgi:hypothetical protein